MTIDEEDLLKYLDDSQAYRPAKAVALKAINWAVNYMAEKTPKKLPLTTTAVLSDNLVSEDILCEIINVSRHIPHDMAVRGSSYFKQAKDVLINKGLMELPKEDDDELSF